jgi:ABC-type proline/glycine betaine transport system ATPase subunit
MDPRKIECARSAIVYGENNANKHCIILMGLPGCGKSTVSRYLHDQYGYSILSGENITYAIF